MRFCLAVTVAVAATIIAYGGPVARLGHGYIELVRRWVEEGEWNS